MVSQYSIVDLPGRSSIKVATIDSPNSNNEQRGVKSPEWMVKIDDLLFSQVAKFNDYCELFGWHAESSRFTNGDVSNELFTSATIRHSDVILIIPNGGYSASLQTYMNRGQVIGEMYIVRLGNVGEMKVVLQQIKFETVRVQSFQQQLDRVIIHTQVLTKTDTHFIYDYTGQIRGQMVTAAHYGFNEVDGDGSEGGDDSYGEYDDY